MLNLSCAKADSSFASSSSRYGFLPTNSLLMKQSHGSVTSLRSSKGAAVVVMCLLLAYCADRHVFHACGVASSPSVALQTAESLRL